jgi:hypothetical protein
MKHSQVIRWLVACLGLCKDMKDETGDVQCTILVIRDGVWGNGRIGVIRLTGLLHV